MKLRPLPLGMYIYVSRCPYCKRLVQHEYKQTFSGVTKANLQLDGLHVCHFTLVLFDCEHCSSMWDVSEEHEVILK